MESPFWRRSPTRDRSRRGSAKRGRTNEGTVCPWSAEASQISAHKSRSGLWICDKAGDVSNSTRRTGIALLGLILGMWISERLLPAPAPAAHVARYGPPVAPSLGGYLLLSAFPAFGTILGAVVRVLA
jgi:hypothetical protein